MMSDLVNIPLETKKNTYLVCDTGIFEHIWFEVLFLPTWYTSVLCKHFFPNYLKQPLSMFEVHIVLKYSIQSKRMIAK